ncbi:MAG: Glucokinase, partial [Candidatus Saccharibacteria bacterium]|nr:Glucokinase [Candidatus Saccharibacteria bacterium]
MQHDANTLPPIDNNLFTGVDVGGTKVEITDTSGPNLNRFNTGDYASLEEILTQYIAGSGSRPARIVIGMAGPRNDETGAVQLTNGTWPTFEPGVASEKFGIPIVTTNDMVVTAAGVMHSQDLVIKTLHSG